MDDEKFQKLREEIRRMNTEVKRESEKEYTDELFDEDDYDEFDE